MGKQDSAVGTQDSQMGKKAGATGKHDGAAGKQHQGRSVRIHAQVGALTNVERQRPTETEEHNADPQEAARSPQVRIQSQFTKSAFKIIA